MQTATAPVTRPTGRTLSELRNGTHAAAAAAPIAIPSPVTPCSTAAFDNDNPRFSAAHLSTTSCNVTAAPHSRVVTHNAIWASLSAHNTLNAWVKSPTSLDGSF